MQTDRIFSTPQLIGKARIATPNLGVKASLIPVGRTGKFVGSTLFGPSRQTQIARKDFELPETSSEIFGKATILFQIMRDIFYTAHLELGRPKEEINIILTTRCQLACDFCLAKDYMDLNRNHEFPADKLSELLLGELKEFHDIYFVRG